MAVECPINNVDQFSKSSRIKLCARRRKDYSKPLHVDCSVEYELPNSAKPPVGNKHEPLLMIHPSYYRLEESKRRSQFVNNLPKRRTSSRYTRSTVDRGVENTSNYGRNNYMSTRHRIHCMDKRSIVDQTLSLSKASVASTSSQASTNYDNTCLQVRTDSHCNRVLQSSLPRTSTTYTPTKVHQIDLVSLWKRTIETNPTSQSTSFDYNEQGVTMLPASEHAPVPRPMPVSNSTSTHIIDSWMPNFHNVPMNSGKHGSSTHDSYNCRTRDRSKNNVDESNAQTSKTRPTKKGVIYCETSVPISASNTTANCIKAGPTALHQRQPAIGVAAIAAPPINYRDCSSTVSTVEGSSHPLMRQQPWSATTAPEFPPTSAPASHMVSKRSLIGVVFPEVTPQLSSARKRTSDIFGRYDEYGSDDSSIDKRNRMGINENVQICQTRPWAASGSGLCKMYYSQEPRDCYDYSNHCGVVGGATATPSSNPSTLHLFRF